MNPRVSVALLPSLFQGAGQIANSCSIVIDVLRATSVMATAGAAGARSMRTCQTIESAQRIADQTRPKPLLCGERQCKPISGFDLGNSPAEYSRQIVQDRDLVLTTTNGTLAVNAVIGARRLLTCSFLNLAATVTAVRDENQIDVICAGTEGQVSYEDVLLAGALVDRLDQIRAPIEIDDSARLAIDAWRRLIAGTTALSDALAHSFGGRNLLRAGYRDDLQRCSAIDSIDGVVERDPGSDSLFRFRSHPDAAGDPIAAKR